MVRSYKGNRPKCQEVRNGKRSSLSLSRECSKKFYPLIEEIETSYASRNSMDIQSNKQYDILIVSDLHLQYVDKTVTSENGQRVVLAIQGQRLVLLPMPSVGKCQILLRMQWL